MTIRKTGVPSKRPKATVGVTYAEFVALAQSFPGVEESTSYGTPALKVKGKLLSRLRSEAEGAVALYCDFVDRELLMQVAPDVFFITDHYANTR